MEQTTQQELFAHTTYHFKRAIKAIKFSETRDLNKVMESLPHIKLREGYSLGHYITGDFFGFAENLYPFRIGASNEYDPGQEHRDIKHHNFFELYQKAEEGDEEAKRLVKIWENPIPFQDGQYVNGELSITASGTVPKLADYLELDFTPISIWESYLLLVEAKSYLPNGWHGAYANGELIMDNNNLISVCSERRKLKESGWESLLNDSRIIPSVTIGSDNEALIQYCRWSDWGGLKRITAHAHKKRRSVSFEVEKERETLIKYDCGIRF